MATYTSTQNGDWDAAATWGGGGWPNAAGDIVNIGHTVTYNVVSTLEMGLITINSGGILSFSTAMSTKLTLGHVDIVINSGGEVRAGYPGTVIPAAYSCELLWNTTSDNVKGISGAGSFYAYGDPALYGDDFDTYLAANWSCPASGTSSFTTGDNMSAKWAAGQILLIHRGGSWVSTNNDFVLVSIDSISGTTVNITIVNAPGGALTFNQYGKVLNASRNVQIGKVGASVNIGNNNTNRPRLIPTNLYLDNILLTGCHSMVPTVFAGNRLVVRNGSGGPAIYSGKATLTDPLIYSCTNAIYRTHLSLTGGYLCNNTSALNDVQSGQADNVHIFGNMNGLNDVKCPLPMKDGFIYANQYDVFESMGNLVNCNLGRSNQYETSGFQLRQPSFIKAVNCLLPSGGIVHTTRERGGYNLFEHYNQTINDHRVYAGFGDILKTPADGTGDNPSQRSGGGVDVQEITPQAICDAARFLELFRVRIWAAASVSRTYRFYVQSTFVSLLTAAFKLYGEYLDAGSGGHQATVSSTQNITTRSNQADWSQYVEVTINPAQAGWVNLYLRLMSYESAKKVWVDPMIVVS